jgi:hypothetical protein
VHLVILSCRPGCHSFGTPHWGTGITGPNFVTHYTDFCDAVFDCLD